MKKIPRLLDELRESRFETGMGCSDLENISIVVGDNRQNE
jgi:hypothetical protein